MLHIKVQLFWEGHKNVCNRLYGFEIYLVNIKTMRTIAQMFVTFSENTKFHGYFISMKFSTCREEVGGGVWLENGNALQVAIFLRRINCDIEKQDERYFNPRHTWNMMSKKSRSQWILFTKSTLVLDPRASLSWLKSYLGTSILLHGGLNPAWHFWLSTRFSCCLKMKSVEKYFRVYSRTILKIFQKIF